MKKSLLWCGLGAAAAGILTAFFLTSAKQKAAPANPIERQATGFENFVGAEMCGKCHAQQYDLWRGATHAKAGGKPQETEIIARFDGQPLRFKDAVVTPTRNAQGDYVFIVQFEGGAQFEIKVDAIVGGGHMYGGGTQSFFNEFPDGTLRFLPFDFGRRQNMWFTQSRKDKTWVPITPELSLKSDSLIGRRTASWERRWNFRIARIAMAARSR